MPHNYRTCIEWASEGGCTTENCAAAHYFFPSVVYRAHRTKYKTEDCRERAKESQGLRGCYWPDDTCGYQHQSPDYILQKKRDRVARLIETQGWDEFVTLKCQTCGFLLKIAHHQDVDTMAEHVEVCRSQRNLEAGIGKMSFDIQDRGEVENRPSADQVKADELKILQFAHTLNSGPSTPIRRDSTDSDATFATQHSPTPRPTHTNTLPTLASLLLHPAPRKEESEGEQKETEEEEDWVPTATCHDWARSNQCSKPACSFAHYFFPHLVYRAYRIGDKEHRCSYHFKDSGCYWAEDTCGFAHQNLDSQVFKKYSNVSERVEEQKWVASVSLTCQICGHKVVSEGSDKNGTVAEMAKHCSGCESFLSMMPAAKLSSRVAAREEREPLTPPAAALSPRDFSGSKQ